MNAISSRARLFPILLPLLAGCITETGDVPTDDITLDFELKLNDSKGLLLGEVHEAGKSLNLDLSSGDSLVAVVDGSERPLTRDGDSGPYVASIPLDASQLVLRFDRADHASASMSIDIPAFADITSPDTFSQQDDEITINWSNAEEGADVTIFAESCADLTVTLDFDEKTKSTIPDEGSYTFTKAELEAEAGFTPDCARLQLLRRHYLRTYPAGTHQSTFVSRRYQSFNISLTP